MSPNTTIAHLPDGVLLEIFDSFRQSFQYESNYERVWNSNKGWFKLSHVCREWRQVVLTSPSRLHMRLLFTEHRSARAIAIKRLPPLPIIFDYKSGACTYILKRMVSALTYPDRVCGIAFKVPRVISKELFAAMDQPFPALDSLELDCLHNIDQNFPPPFLTARPPHLRRLKLTNYASTFSCHILSRTVSPVYLSLRVDRIFFSTFEAQFLSHLQGMPLLCHLELEMWGMPRRHDTTSVPSSGIKNVLLPKLNFLCFTGHITQLEPLMECLGAPDLQELRIDLHYPYSYSATAASIFSPATSLSKFVSNIGKSFSCAQLNASRKGIKLIHPSKSS